jgi:cytochrome P450
MAAVARQGSASPDEIFAALLSPEGMADPYPHYQALHELGEVVKIGPSDFAALSFEAVNAVLRDPGSRVTDLTAGEADGQHQAHFPGSLLSTNGEAHARVRGVLAAAFTRRRMAGLIPAVERIAAALIADMTDRGARGQPVDFMAAFAYLLPVNVICELLGVPETDLAAFRPAARKLALALDFTDDPEVLATADAAAAWLRAYFTRLAAQRRKAPADDLITALVQAGEVDGTLSQAELLVNLTLLLFAGFETTTNLLGNGLAILLSRPATEAGLRDGTIAPADFVTETLRFDAPVQAATDRWRRETGFLAGLSVPAGSRVLPLIGAANRDPRRFRAPGTFDPARKDAGALSFGAGPHFCLGAALARMEAELAFPLLLRSFPRLALAGQPVRRQGLALRGFDLLTVTAG